MAQASSTQTTSKECVKLVQPSLAGSKALQCLRNLLWYLVVRILYSVIQAAANQLLRKQMISEISSSDYINPAAKMRLQMTVMTMNLLLTSHP